MKSTHTRRLTYTALMIALLIICSQIAIPVGPLIYTLQTLAVLLIGFLLPVKYAFISTVLYIAMGLAGLPVFANFGGGIGSFVSPTFGFIISFVVAATFIAYYIQKNSMALHHMVIAAIIATIIIYILGFIYFTYVMNVLNAKAMGTGQIFSLVVLPYLPGDAAKAALAILVATRLKPMLTRVFD